MNNLTKKQMIEEISETLNCPSYIVDCLNKLSKYELEGLHYHTIQDVRTGRRR